jgi:hypothetical protein
VPPTPVGVETPMAYDPPSSLSYADQSS